MSICKFPSPLHPDFNISLALFDDVSNCSDLKGMVMRSEIDVALIKPAMVSILVDNLSVLYYRPTTCGYGVLLK